MGKWTRITVNLIPRAVAALDQARAITGLSQTDVVNRALQAYAFLEKEGSEGARVLIERNGKITEVRLL